MRKITLFLAFMIGHFCYSQTVIQTTFGPSAWKALVTLPPTYNSTLDSFPIIIFVPGAGEIGGGYSALDDYGPHARIAGGWDGGVSLPGGTTIYPILISLEPNTDFVTNGASVKVVMDTILNRYRAKRGSVLGCGFSAGSYMWKILSTEDSTDESPPYGPFVYADYLKALFDLQGVLPDDNPFYLTSPKNFARNKWGGKYMGYWGTGDGIRGMDKFKDTMNIAVPGSAFLNNTSDGHNSTAWNRFYGSDAGSEPEKFNMEGNGLMQDLYQWLIRQGDTTLPIPGALMVNAGIDQNIQLPTSSVTVSGSVSGGSTPYSYSWTKTSGPGTPTITSSTSISTTITGLSTGTYVFRITVTDNASVVLNDELTITVQPECYEGSPNTYLLTPTGLNEIYITNAKTRPWKPGDTVRITAGNYSVIHIDSLRGDKCNYLNIRFEPGVVVNGSLRFNYAEYVDINGYDSTQSKRYYCGPKSRGISLVKVRYLNAQYLESANSTGTGLYCKIDVNPADPTTWRSSGFVMRRVKLLHLWLHDNPGENSYVGHTSPAGDVYHPNPETGELIPAILMDSVEIAYWTVETSGWDGIQLSGAGDGAKIHHNIVNDFGMKNYSGQRAGIILGSMTSGDVYNNKVRNGMGNGIQVFGYGVCNVYDNSIDSVARTRGDSNIVTHQWKGEQSFYADARNSEDKPALQVNFYNNTITHVSPYENGAISIPNGNVTMGLSSVINNIICIPGADTGTWQAKHIKLYPGFTNTNNQLQCTNLGCNCFSGTIKY